MSDKYHLGHLLNIINKRTTKTFHTGHEITVLDYIRNIDIPKSSKDAGRWPKQVLDTLSFSSNAFSFIESVDGSKTILKKDLIIVFASTQNKPIAGAYIYSMLTPKFHTNLAANLFSYVGTTQQ